MPSLSRTSTCTTSSSSSSTSSRVSRTRTRLARLLTPMAVVVRSQNLSPEEVNALMRDMQEMHRQRKEAETMADLPAYQPKQDHVTALFPAFESPPPPYER
ncbi:hypothetical protein JCM11251_001701 [Rhodosporidiobolus azoricus]